MKRRRSHSSDPTQLKPGDIEYELGQPIPGLILEPEKWVQTALKKLPESGQLDWGPLFGRLAPLAIDIGCGNGRFTISSGVRRPDWNHLAIDILPAVIRYATRRGNQRGLGNVRFAVCDGLRLLRDYVPNESVDEFHIYHPQPYPNPRDSHRRLLTPEFLGLMHLRLKRGGMVYLQTDRKEYWEYMDSTFPTIFQWEQRSDPWEDEPYGRSRREEFSRGRKLNVYRAIACKTESSEMIDLQEKLAQLPYPNFHCQN